MNRSILIAVAIIVAVAGWIVSGQFGPGIQKTEITTGHVKETAERPLASVRYIDSVAHQTPEIIRVFGLTEADRAVTVRAETAGTVAKVLAGEGRRLKQDADIVRLDMDNRDSVLSEAQGELDFRDKAYRAAKTLSKKQFSSEVKLAEVAADLARARAAVASAKLDIRFTQIKTPFEGVVNKIAVEPGEVVDVGADIAYVADLDPAVVAVDVSERNIDSIRLGDKATVKIVGHPETRGRVRYVSRSGDLKTRTFRVEIAIDNPDYAIAEGLTAEVRLETGSWPAHKIAPSALTLDDAGRLGVRVIDDENKALFRPIEIVHDEIDGIWVRGLRDRERIIVTGQAFVTDGEPVDPVEVSALTGALLTDKAAGDSSTVNSDAD